MGSADALALLSSLSPDKVQTKYSGWGITCGAWSSALQQPEAGAADANHVYGFLGRRCSRGLLPGQRMYCTLRWT